MKKESEFYLKRCSRHRLHKEELDELGEIPNLAPGDFRTVRQEQFYLDEAQTNLGRIAALKEECALKKDDQRTARIGFAA